MKTHQGLVAIAIFLQYIHVVRSELTSIPILRGVRQGSVLPLTFFLVIMDELFHRLSESSCGVSICHLYLGGAAHGDDVRAIVSYMFVAEAQSVIFSDF